MTEIVPPSCEHGPMMWKEWADEHRSWAAWLPRHGKGESWADARGLSCKPVFVRVNGRAVPHLAHLDPAGAKPTVGPTPKETLVRRIYNPETSRYEAPDPWAGAPADALAKGIRLQHPDGNAGIWTDTHSYWKTDIFPSGPWAPREHMGLQYCLDANRGRGHRFPDFDGAPEGVRFYVRNDLFPDSKSWRPRVSIGGQVFTRISNGEWKPVGQHATIEWYRDNRSNSWSAVMVDEEPVASAAAAEPPANPIAEHIAKTKMYFRKDTLEHLRVASLDDLLDEVKRRAVASSERAAAVKLSELKEDAA